MKSRRWSTIVETWMESVRHGESGRHWWEFIRRQNLGRLRRLDRRRGSERRRRRSDVGRIPGGSLLTRTSAGGYFIPNTSSLTSEFEFQMKEVQRNFYSQSCLLNPAHDRPRKSWNLMRAYWSLFPIKAIRRVLSEFSLERNSKRHTIMVPLAVSPTPR